MIPQRIRKLINTDEDYINFYYKSAFTGESVNIEWHHVFKYGQASIQEIWNILPLTEREHNECTPHNNNYKAKQRRKAEWITLNRAGRRYLNREYPKKNWNQLATVLNEEFGNYQDYEFKAISSDFEVDNDA